jgi:hypothetical protein
MPIQRSLPLVLLLAGLGCVSPSPSPPEVVDALPEYRLPYRAGTRHLCIQGGPGLFGHRGDERYAVDFKMEVGTAVHAAREGRVVAVKQDSAIGGISRKYGGHGNLVRIRHNDGSWAVYLHLMQGGALVEEGQWVERGQPIAYSGSTGRSATPHLHFHVARRAPDSRRIEAVRVRFRDVAGDGEPRSLWIYEAGDAPPDATR